MLVVASQTTSQQRLPSGYLSFMTDQPSQTGFWYILSVFFNVTDHLQKQNK